MSTKAEVMAAVEAITKATVAAAKVASELQEAVVIPPPVQTADIAFIELADRTLVISGGPGITSAKWTTIQNQAPNYTWYGQLQTVTLPAIIKPAYAAANDFVKVFYGTNYTKSMDSPKPAPAPVTPVPTVPATPSSGGARAFVRNMTVNVNFERMRPTYMQYQGTPTTKAPYYQYLAGKGISGVRFFIPYRADRDQGIGTGVPDVGTWDAILDAAQAANMAGLQVMCGCTDVVGEGVIKYDDWKQHADNVAKRVSERGFEPSKFALEVANELAGNDNAFWNDMRTGVHDVIRKRLPNHTIIHGCAGWNGIGGWNDTWKMPADNNIVLQFHDYVYRSEADWSSIEVSLTDFARKFDVPIINGEQGIDFGRSGQEFAKQWMENLWNMSKGAGILRPCPWTITGDPNGGAFRLNRSGVDPTLLSTFEDTLPYLNNLIKATPGWGV
jgi:hypothetical protein